MRVKCYIGNKWGGFDTVVEVDDVKKLYALVKEKYPDCFLNHYEVISD
jgi:hypothetical protein